jgi:hypothetical protein
VILSSWAMKEHATKVAPTKAHQFCVPRFVLATESRHGEPALELLKPKGASTDLHLKDRLKSAQNLCMLILWRATVVIVYAACATVDSCVPTISLFFIYFLFFITLNF